MNWLALRVCGVLILRDNLAEFLIPTRSITDAFLTSFILGRIDDTGYRRRNSGLSVSKSHSRPVSAAKWALWC